MGGESLLYVTAGLAGAAVLCLVLLLAGAAQARRREEELLLLVREMRQGGSVLEKLIRDEARAGREEAANAGRGLRDEVGANLTRLNDLIRSTLEALGGTLGERLAGFEVQVRRLTGETGERQEQLRTAVDQRLIEARSDNAVNAKATRDEIGQALHKLAEELRSSVGEMTVAQGQRLEEVKQAVQGRLDILRQENEAKLEQMRQTVDEKLQGTLEKRLGESFGLVSKQLEQVHKSVGEMQTLAAGVGDLKRVLTNVKTRGTWGEVSLGALLEQVMSPEQFARNVEVVPGSNRRVEFAIRLPGDGDAPVWLPIDAKFPLEDYERLVDAAQSGDREAEEAAIKAIETSIRTSGKNICARYVQPPHSTDFGILYVPTEGLYAEILRRPGLASGLQLECKVAIAGPMTLLALLTSLQVGFRSLAIQKRSSEVWQVLGAVKAEFGKYGDVLDKVQQKLRQADGEIEKVRVRERAIGRKLRDVETLSESDSGRVLQLEDYLADVDTLPLLGERTDQVREPAVT